MCTHLTPLKWKGGRLWEKYSWEGQTGRVDGRFAPLPAPAPFYCFLWLSLDYISWRLSEEPVWCQFSSEVMVTRVLRLKKKSDCVGSFTYSLAVISVFNLQDKRWESFHLPSSLLQAGTFLFTCGHLQNCLQILTKYPWMWVLGKGFRGLLL